ncbi:MAG: hypothetical protein ACYS6K_17245 [Planctomycetota bacterium]
MRILLRILPFAFLIWLICCFLNSPGRKRTPGDYKRNGEPPTKRKQVESREVANDSE